MWLTSRRSIDQSLFSTRCNRINEFCRRMTWKVFVLAVSIQIVGGSAYDDYNNSEYEAEEEERVHELIVDEWYNLVRYLVGLSLCIFGLIGVYFHQFASYYFLKRYTRPRETERRIGRVVSCEPLLRSNSCTGKKSKKKKKKKRKKKYIGIRVPTFGGKVAAVSGSATDYIREEDLESRRKQNLVAQDGEFTDYRMLVVYRVPKPRQKNLLCCSPTSKNLTINCTNSFTAVTSCATDLGDSETDDDAAEAIKTYRSRSLPSPGNSSNPLDDFSDKISNSMDYMHMNSECEYFQWFQTNTMRPVDSDIELILLQGQPTSACTPELLETHLAQVGKMHEGEEQSFCKSIPLMGVSLVIAIVVLCLVCVIEIQAMPHPETQRPIGYTVLGGIFFGSIVCAYLFSRLLFEQYKQKVFLSAFMVPSSAVRRKSASSNADSFVTESTGIVADDAFKHYEEQYQHPHDEPEAHTLA